MLRKSMTLAVILAASSLSMSTHAGYLYLGPTLFIEDNTSSISNYRGIHPRLSLGYADMYEDLYLSGELFAVPTTATVEDNHSNGSLNSVRTTRSYGASFIPGARITEQVLGFIRLGVVSTQFSGPNTSRAGAQFGLGLQTCLTSYWDLRAEYIYTTYKTLSSLGAVKSDQVGIGLVYKVMG